MKGLGEHHPYCYRVRKNHSDFPPGGQSWTGKHNSPPPRMSPPPGSRGGLNLGNMVCPAAEGNPTPLSHVHVEIPRDTVRDRRGCRLETGETLDRKPDRHRSGSGNGVERPDCKAYAIGTHLVGSGRRPCRLPRSLASRGLSHAARLRKRAAWGFPDARPRPASRTPSRPARSPHPAAGTCSSSGAP